MSDTMYHAMYMAALLVFIIAVVGPPMRTGTDYMPHMNPQPPRRSSPRRIIALIVAAAFAIALLRTKGVIR